MAIKEETGAVVQHPIKTPLAPHIAQPESANPFSRARWTLNEIEGKWDSAVRHLLQISQCKDLRDARRIAIEALDIMSRPTQRSS